MKAGKLPAETLEALVLRRLTRRRPEVVVSAALGEDAAVLDFGGDLVVASSDPITGAGFGAAGLAVDVSCNDIGAMGAEPVGLLVTALFPETTLPDHIQSAMEEIEHAAARLNVEVVGGHTEITSLVTAPILVVTAIGRVQSGRLVRSSGASRGDAVILTKGAGIEGTAILAADHASLLAPLGEDLLARARAFAAEISAVADGRIAALHGASAQHDVTEGGVVGACVELARASGCGITIHRAAVPVRPETAAICAQLGLDPLRLISSGALLVCTAQPDHLLRALKDSGVLAHKIGRVSDGEGVVVVEDDGSATRYTNPPEDELWRFLAS